MSGCSIPIAKKPLEGNGSSREISDRLRAVFLFTVPELTRGADIKLNSGVSLQPRLHRIVITHRTISLSVRAHSRQCRQAIILRLAALLPALGGCSSMVERWLPSQRCRFDSATCSRVTGRYATFQGKWCL